MSKATASLVKSILEGNCKDPHVYLGMHIIKEKDKEPGIVVRAYYPDAHSIDVIEASSNVSYLMKKVYPEGIFEVIIPGRNDIFEYKLNITFECGSHFETYDPYSFWPVLSEYDLYLFNQGNNHRIFEKLGAHIMTINNISGTLFSVWAPNAKRVSVVGCFNQWDGRRHQMRQLGVSGVWEIFIPLVQAGDTYKFEIKTRNNEIYLKSDPYAYSAELRPATASVVADIDSYTWNDSAWMDKREKGNIFEQPVSVYELHLGSWRTQLEPDENDNIFLNYRELAKSLIPYVKEMGYTHIELLPVTEHPFDGSWGYQVTGYYAATSRYGSPQDFMYFIDQCHQNNIGVILDWVPAHFPKDAHGLARFDGTALYEHENPLQGEHPEWGTHIFNHGRLEVRNFLISNAVFWLDKYHIDGLRVDAVASMLYLDYAKKPGQWIPNKYGDNCNLDALEFLKLLNTTVFSYYKGIMMVAEESSAWPMITRPVHAGGLGFTFKWNMGWMNDVLKYVSMDPIYRRYHHNNITFSLMYAFNENFMLVLSHDEVVHGKCSMLNKQPGDYWQKFAGLRATYGYTYGHPGKKLLFMGGEFGQFVEWNENQSLDWHLLDFDMHKKLQNYVKDLNHLYATEKSLHQVDFSYDGFEWIDCNDNESSVFSFIRKAKDPKDFLIFVCNFTPIGRQGYAIGTPYDVSYNVILNSNYEKYGGYTSDSEQVTVTPVKEWLHGRPQRLYLDIPPYGVMVLKPNAAEMAELARKEAEAAELAKKEAEAAESAKKEA